VSDEQNDAPTSDAPQSQETGGEATSPKSRKVSRKRRANAAGGRHYAHQVKVTPEEEAVLLQLAAKQGVSVPRLLVESALAVEDRTTATDRREAIAELFRIHRVLGGAANNMNQLAKVANATGEVPAEFGPTMGYVRRLCTRIDTTIDKLALP